MMTAGSVLLRGAAMTLLLLGQTGCGSLSDEERLPDLEDVRRPDLDYRTVVDDPNWLVLYTPLVEEPGPNLLLKSLWVERRNPAVVLEEVSVQFMDKNGKVICNDYNRPWPKTRFAQVGESRCSAPEGGWSVVATVKASHEDAPRIFNLHP
jgi:hypothetical protein